MKILKINLMICCFFVAACGPGPGEDTREKREIPDTVVIQEKEPVVDDEFDMAEALKEYYKQQEPEWEEAFRREHTSRNSLDYHGDYKGTLPCADCEGIMTKISLNLDYTFRMTRRYLGKDDREYVIEGTFSWEECGNIIRLNELDKPNQYHVGEMALFQLDMDGNRITGDLAHKYTLVKQ